MQPQDFSERRPGRRLRFEAIHSFLDGNGRIGRLLTLLLVPENVLPQPMLYLSSFFEKNRNEYYRRLLAVSQDGQWSEWVSFFLRGIAEQSRDAVQRSEKLLGVWQRYRQQFQTVRSSASLNVEKLVTGEILEELPGRKLWSYLPCS